MILGQATNWNILPMQIFHVDAFARALFQGNPAAIVPLHHWLQDVSLTTPRRLKLTTPRRSKLNT
jgi:hypothetical protein